jgi:hypothetical protein
MAELSGEDLSTSSFTFMMIGLVLPKGATLNPVFEH